MRPRSRYWGVCIVCIAGCGLGDYETQMATTQKNMARVDQQNQYLGDPLVLPSNRALAAGEAFFLRPPRQINSAPLATSFGPGNLMQYSGRGGYNYLYLLIGKDRKQEEFWNDVLATFPEATPDTFQEVKKQPLVGPPMIFHESITEVPGPPSYQRFIEFHQSGPYWVGLVYQIDGNYYKQNAAQVKAAVEASLQTLRIGPVKAR